MVLRMSTDAAHKNSWQTFEAVFGIPFLAAIILQFAIPLSFPFGSFTPFVILGSVILIIVGVVFVIRARREFALHGQQTDPGHPTSKVITTDVFSISRNPLYLGGVCVLAAIALAANLPWVFVSFIPALLACHYVLIAPEEKYLTAKFGDEYRMYTATVHRWLGRARRPS